jgi:hypothetical protein
MYGFRRADRASVENGSGEFVVLIDLDGFSLSTVPPLSQMKTALNLLKRHYPYRLGGIFIVNVSGPFSFVWSMVKPLMPKKALGKTFVLSSKEAATTLDEQIGLGNIEKPYGGTIDEPFPTESSVSEDDLDSYFNSGYWKVT